MKLLKFFKIAAILVGCLALAWFILMTIFMLYDAGFFISSLFFAVDFMTANIIGIICASLWTFILVGFFYNWNEIIKEFKND